MNFFYKKEEFQKLGGKSLGDNVLISSKASFYGAENIEIESNLSIEDFYILNGRIQIGNCVYMVLYKALVLHFSSGRKAV